MKYQLLKINALSHLKKRFNLRIKKDIKTLKSAQKSGRKKRKKMMFPGQTYALRRKSYIVRRNALLPFITFCTQYLCEENRCLKEVF